VESIYINENKSFTESPANMMTQSAIITLNTHHILFPNHQTFPVAPMATFVLKA
jgi:hypothetical protein